jgi:hypothetical protein
MYWSMYFILHWLLLFFMNLFGYMAHQTWVVWILAEFATFFLVFLFAPSYSSDF